MEQGYLGDGAILVLHYESFAYDIITEYHESLTDFLCELHDSNASNQKVSLRKAISFFLSQNWRLDWPCGGRLAHLLPGVHILHHPAHQDGGEGEETSGTWSGA